MKTWIKSAPAALLNEIHPIICSQPCCSSSFPPPPPAPWQQGPRSPLRGRADAGERADRRHGAQRPRPQHHPMQAAAAVGSAGRGCGLRSSPVCGAILQWGGLTGAPQWIASGCPRQPCTPRGRWPAEGERGCGLCPSTGMGLLWAQDGPAGHLFSSGVPMLGRWGHGCAWLCLGG